MPVQSKFIANGYEMLAHARRTGVRIGERVDMPSNTFYYELDMGNGFSMKLFMGEYVLGLAVKDSNHVIEKEGRKRSLHDGLQVPEGETYFLHELVGLRDLKGRAVDPFFVEHRDDAILVNVRVYSRVGCVEALFLLALKLAA